MGFLSNLVSNIVDTGIIQSDEFRNYPSVATASNGSSCHSKLETTSNEFTHGILRRNRSSSFLTLTCEGIVDGAPIPEYLYTSKRGPRCKIEDIPEGTKQLVFVARDIDNLVDYGNGEGPQPKIHALYPHVPVVDPSQADGSVNVPKRQTVGDGNSTSEDALRNSNGGGGLQPGMGSVDIVRNMLSKSLQRLSKPGSNKDLEESESVMEDFENTINRDLASLPKHYIIAKKWMLISPNIPKTPDQNRKQAEEAMQTAQTNAGIAPVGAAADGGGFVPPKIMLNGMEVSPEELNDPAIQKALAEEHGASEADLKEIKMKKAELEKEMGSNGNPPSSFYQIIPYSFESYSSFLGDIKNDQRKKTHQHLMMGKRLTTSFVSDDDHSSSNMFVQQKIANQGVSDEFPHRLVFQVYALNQNFFDDFLTKPQSKWTWKQVHDIISRNVISRIDQVGVLFRRKPSDWMTEVYDFKNRTPQMEQFKRADSYKELRQPDPMEGFAD